MGLDLWPRKFLLDPDILISDTMSEYELLIPSLWGTLAQALETGGSSRQRSKLPSVSGERWQTRKAKINSDNITTMSTMAIKSHSLRKALSIKLHGLMLKSVC